MATPIVASRSSWSPHVYEQEAPAINRQQRRQQLHSMKQAIMDKLVGLPMEREDDMVGFVGWLNTFVDRSLTERGLPALTGPPRANDRQQAGMGSVYESHRKVMDDVVDDSGLRRPIRRGEGGGGAVAIGGTGRSEPLRDMSQRNHDEADLKAASSGGRAGTLTKKDTEVSLAGEESAPFVLRGRLLLLVVIPTSVELVHRANRRHHPKCWSI